MTYLEVPQKNIFHIDYKKTACYSFNMKTIEIESIFFRKAYRIMIKTVHLKKDSEDDFLQWTKSK